MEPSSGNTDMVSLSHNNSNLSQTPFLAGAGAVGLSSQQ